VNVWLEMSGGVGVAVGVGLGEGVLVGWGWMIFPVIRISLELFNSAFAAGIRAVVSIIMIVKMEK